MEFLKPIASSLLILAIAPTLALSAPAAGKVRSALGNVDRWKAKQSEWAALRVGANIYQSDRVRTGVESEVIFALPDGSTIAIAENTEVEMVNLLEPNDEGGFETRIDIQKGHLNFAVEKLQEKKSKFIFKTGTATASIRGTQGFVGGEGAFFAGLKTGKLEIANEKQTVSIVAGETTFGSDSLVVVKLASSGDARFAKRLEKILAEKNKKIEELVVEVQKADSTYQSEVKAEKENAAAQLLENGFTITTGAPLEICDDGLVIEGAYKTADESAKLIMKVGNYTSENLIKAFDGNPHNFSEKLSITDENGLWNVDKAAFEFMGAGSTVTKAVDLKVNKSCLGVNTIAPKVSIASYDSLRCSANIYVSEMQNDAGIVTILADGSTMEEDAITKNMQKRLKLKKGRHKYDVKIQDQAGNEFSASKNMGCYPVKKFNIDFFGKSHEILRVPPPPKDIADRIMQTLQFRIKEPDNTPENLYKVTVKHNGKVILQETLSQIQNLDYQITVELLRGASNRFEVEAIHKSGYRAHAKKIYEVR